VKDKFQFLFAAALLGAALIFETSCNSETKKNGNDTVKPDTSGANQVVKSDTGLSLADDGFTPVPYDAGGGAIRLRFALEKGNTYFLNTERDQVAWVSMTGQNEKISENLKLDQEHSPFSASSGRKFGIRGTYTRVQYKQGLPTGTDSYDSKNKAGVTPPMVAKMHDVVIGRSLKWVLGESGKVDTLTGADEAVLSVVEQMQEGAAKDMFRKKLVILFGNSYSANSLEFLTGMYPEGPVKKGDSWTRELQQYSGMSLDILAKYEIADIQKDVASIRISGTVAGGPGESAIGSGLAGKLDVSGTIKGSATIDLQSGWVKSSEITFRFKGKLDAGSDQFPVDISIVHLAKGGMKPVEREIPAN